MDISYICEFVVLADTRSYSGAAYQLHMSQSTLSRHIQAMEKELGYTLFVRTTRKVELSEFGRIYLPYARRIADNARRADEAVSSYGKQKNKITTVGIVHNPNLYMITECLVGFRREYPDIPLKVLETSLDELQQKFRSGKLRIVTMTFADWEKPEYGFIPAGKSRLVAMLPKNHPLAVCEQIPLSSLVHVPLLVPGQNTRTYQYLEHIFKEKEIPLNIVYQGSSTGIPNLLEDGMGIRIEDEALAKENLKESLIIRKLDPDISYIFGLQYRNNLTKNERIYVNYIRDKLGTEYF